MTEDIRGPRAVEEGLVEELVADTSEQDRETVKTVMRRFDRARKARQPIDRHWPRYYNLWATQQWKGITVEHWRSKPQVNFIFSTIELAVATMTDQDPQIVVFPRSNLEENIEVADILTKILANSWRKAKGRTFLKNVVKNSEIYGTGIGKVAWDDKRQDVELVSVPPDRFYIDPSASSIDDAWYIFHVYDVSMNSIRAGWPEKAGQVKAGILRQDGRFPRDAWASEDDTFPVGGVDRLTFTEGSSTHTTRTKTGSGEPIGLDDDMVTLVEYWERSPEDNTITLYYIAGGILLEKIENPLGKGFEGFPFVRMVNREVDGEFWGISTIQALEPLQLSINKRRQQIIDNLRILGHPPIIADRSSGLEEDLVLGAPGEIILKNPGSEVRWLDPPPMPPGLFQVQQLDKSEFETVSGMFDVVQGRTPTGIEAAAAIAELQEAAQVRLRDKVSYMEQFLEELGRMMLKLIQANYDTEKALVLTGRDGALEEVHINAPVDIRAAQDLIDEEIAKGVDLDIVERALDVTRGDFDVEVKAGSTMPVSKAARLNEALLLFDRGIVDLEEVLTAVGHPRKREILQRLRQQVGQEAALGSVQDQLSQIVDENQVVSPTESPEVNPPQSNGGGLI